MDGSNPGFFLWRARRAHAGHSATMENKPASSSHDRQAGRGGAQKDAPDPIAGASVPTVAIDKTSPLSDEAASKPLPETPCPSPPETAGGQGSDGGVAVLSAAAAAAWAASGQVANQSDGKKEGADASTAAAAAAGATTNSGTSKSSGGRLARAPRTISPAPFRRSESAKAMAEAAAVVTSSTVSASAASTQASISGKMKPDTSSSAASGNASDDSNGVSNSVNTKQASHAQGATSTTGDMQTPTRSPIHRRPVLTSAVATAATSQTKSGMEGDRQHPPLPGPPPLTSASPLRSSLASLQNSIADDESQTKDQSTTDGEKKDDAKTAPEIELNPEPPILQSLRQMPLNKMLSKPRRPSKCPLFCAFYSEFDNVVGPKLCFQSPANFMQSPITAEVGEIHKLLAKEFELIFPVAKEEEKKKNDDSTKTVDGGSEESAKNQSSSSLQKGIDEPSGDDTEKVAKNGGGLPNLQMPDIEDDGDASKQGVQTTEFKAAAAKKMESTTSAARNEETKPGGRPPIPLKRPNRPNNVPHQSQAAPDVENIHGFAIETGDTSDGSPGSFSIFDSTSEYIITGNDIADHMICLSTHNMHILTRPTIIKDTRYERNSLLFSVGFVIRRLVDPRPYRLILSKLAQTLRIMEVESRFLTSKETRPELRRILQSILVSLNSRRSECNLLLDSANVLNLKLFRPPREPVPPVPDHAVPILLRPEAQMQLFDWDLTINWIVPHIDGFKHAKLISQSSEVDMEMVRACLRVLRHHGVLALVDVFRYANIYESTPLAASMLAGDQTTLLEEAYAFASKSTNIQPLPPMKSDASSGGSRPGSRAATPSFLEHYQGNPLSPRSLGDNPNTPSGRDITLSPAALGFDPSTLIRPLSGASLVPPTGQSLGTSFPPRAANRPDAPIGASSSQPTRDGATSSSAQQHMAASHASSRLSMSTSEAAQEAAVLPSKKKERKMKSALALLYNSCTRSKSFGELLIEKVVARPPSRDVDRPRGATTPTRRMRERGSSSALDSDGNDSGHNSAQEGGSLSSTPREEFGVSSPGRSGRSNRGNSAVDDLDWSEVFDHFDHRRLVTFGVVHGLIQRVHIFPMAYEIGDETSQHTSDDESPSGSFVDDLSDGPIRTRTDQQSYTVGSGYHFQRNARGKTYTSPTLQPVPFSAAAPSPLASALKSTMPPTPAMAPLSLGINAAMGDSDVVSGPKAIKARQAKEQLKRLSYEISEAMDGSRCDDELACMYEKPFDELLELVKEIGKEVVTIKSIATATTTK